MTPFGRNTRYLLSFSGKELNMLSESTGISPEILSRIMNNAILPDCLQALAIAEFFNLPLEQMLTKDIEENLAKIRDFTLSMLLLDVDGVITDGGMYYTEKGDEFKKFNTKDGLAIIRLIEKGIIVGLISSGSNSSIIENRARSLGIQKVYFGTWKKDEIFDKWCAELSIDPQNVAYVGDDLNDLPVIRKAGLSACPSDAAQAVIKEVDIVLNTRGGEGCIRELADEFLSLSCGSL